MFYWKWGWSTKRPNSKLSFHLHDSNIGGIIATTLSNLLFTFYNLENPPWMKMYFLLNGGDFPANPVCSQRYTISKKEREGHQVAQHMWKQTKTSRSWVLGWWEETVTKRMPFRDPRQLCNFLVFDGQNFEMQNIATLHIAWGARPPRMPHPHEPFNLLPLANKSQGNLNKTSQKHTKTPFWDHFLWNKTHTIHVYNIHVVVWESYPLASENIPP